MTNRRTTLIVALVLAVLTGWLTLRYVSSMQASTQAAGAPRPIIVAAQEIPARVPITAAMLARTSRPASAVEPDAVADPSRIVGSLSLITIPAGSTITASKIGHPSDVGLPVRLKTGMRAVSLQIDKVKGVSGLVEPGDRVDVIAVPARQGDAPPTAATILRGVRVLAMGDTLENNSATPSPQESASTTVTLEVTPKQANLLAMADLNTTLRLAARSSKEPVNSLPAEALQFSAMHPQTSAAAPPQGNASAATDAVLVKALMDQRNNAAQRSAPAASAPRSSSSVEVIDGSANGNGAE